MIGRILSHYRIEGEISRGGMGIVYRAVDTKLDREVALKVLPPELVSDAERRARFVQEAKAASKLEHPHIAVIHEIDEAEGVTFIAMELIRGEKLSDALERERLSVTRALDLATEVAEGLARAHDKGIIHRDLKPANIMVTEDGHAKIIDFGLAKLIAPLAGEGSELQTALRRETDPGVVMGTVSYMSPEQARGVKIDHRTDVFTFGIVLSEMLVGQAPFRGATGMDTLQAIIKEPAPPLPALGAGVSVEAAFDLQRILDKCLAKDPAERYQWMKDLVVDLRAARRRLESAPLTSAVRIPSTPGPELRAPSRRRPWFAAAIAASLLFSAGAVYLFVSGTSPREDPIDSSRPSVAVLYFENNTGDPSLDWLRTALTDMLVTDLSQSPQMEVLGTDRLYQILKEMNRLDERVTSFEVVQEVAQRANVSTVLLGSFVKVGENVRISARLQEARTGKILTTEKVEGVGEDSIFPMVDDLTRRIQSKFNLSGGSAPELDQDLKEVTTSSLEAYRFYAEGINLHNRYKEEEAVPLFEKAVEIDPDFAMALAKLAIIHGNLNHPKKREEYGKRALEHVNRLTARERYYIEGIYYSDRPLELGRAIEAYRKAVDLYPDHSSARHNLALIYLLMGRYDDAVPLYEELRRRGMPFPSTYGQLAAIYGARGEFERGRDVLEDFIRRNPDNAQIHRALGNYLVNAGRPDEALAAYQKAESLEPGNLALHQGLWQLSVLKEQWREADATAQTLLASSEPFRKWQGAVGLANVRLYQGRSKEALELFRRAAGAYPEPGRQTAEAHLNAAQLLLDRGDSARALEEATLAARHGKGDWVEWWAHLPAALAQAKLGRWEEANRDAAEFKQFADSLDAPSWKQDYQRLAGELALLRADAARAVTELRSAEALLTPHGWAQPSSRHVPIWFSLGSAYLEAGQDEEAFERFRRVAETAGAHVYHPIPYVRSFYFLARIYEKRGEKEKAREHYERFIKYWRDGDLDRERVIEALDRIS